MAAKHDPVLVIGGGLGGAAVALALGRKGFAVRVLEQAPEFGVIGYGIQLGPNVFSMFDRLGVTDAVLAQAIVPDAILMIDSVDAGVIVRIPTGASFRARFKRPYIVIHRVDLHRVLLDACKALPKVELIANTEVEYYENHDDRVVVRTRDNRTFDGAALIGADGLRSTVRAQMLAEGDPRMIGYVAHRTIVPMNDLRADVHRNAVVLWSGPGFHIVHYPLRGGALFNIVAVFRTSTYAEKGDGERYRAELDHTYRDSHPVMKALLAMMDLDRRWVISDRDPIRHWSAGRVTLLGDAAHPTLQTLAQGACMAIEDAVCLAELVALAHGDFARAFRQYETARYLRTARVQFESRYFWDNFYHLGGIEREVARSAWAGRNEQQIFDCLAWLYDGFALPDRLPEAA
ncbi:MAG TPA: 3-hydroxybenzoate 6-monooxygenase [Xanthobacteraceae bacterium]|nr:3-hydroxybenzoate 6-monooxygenase [Xanthobacteraceae bacterium]